MIARSDAAGRRRHRRVRLEGRGVPQPPETPPDESPETWGDPPDPDSREEAWLRAQVPPHAVDP